MDFHSARALLAWQVELGADEAILDAPLNRYDVPAVLPKAVGRVAAKSVAKAVAPQSTQDGMQGGAVALASSAAGAAGDLEGLRAAMAAYEHCELKRGARNLVFADGAPGARVMIIGEAPGRDEDRAGRPFVGRAGQLLDRMLGAIGLSRAEGSVYITNVLPWRPPQNRDPLPEEIDMMRPFIARHVALAAPEIVVLMGNISCLAGLRTKGITRLRGQWSEAYGVPALPMFHPAYLLRNPGAKREAWADLLALQAHLRGNSGAKREGRHEPD